MTAKEIDLGITLPFSEIDLEEAEHDQVPSVEEVRLTASQFNSRGRRRCAAVLTVNVLGLLAVVIGLSVIISRSDSAATSPVNTNDSSSSPTEPSPHSTTTLQVFPLSSDSFEPNGPIPSKHTSDGADVSPSLSWSWSDVPEGTKSFALVVEDPDAPDPAAPRETPWVHWIMYNIPPDTIKLSEDITNKELPPGTLQGLNDWSETGYRGPSPSIGQHRYFFKLYALDTMLPYLGAKKRETLMNAMHGHVLGMGELIGTYQEAGS